MDGFITKLADVAAYSDLGLLKECHQLRGLNYDDIKDPLRFYGIKYQISDGDVASFYDSVVQEVIKKISRPVLSRFDKSSLILDGLVTASIGLLRPDAMRTIDLSSMVALGLALRTTLANVLDGIINEQVSLKWPEHLSGENYTNNLTSYYSFCISSVLKGLIKYNNSSSRLVFFLCRSWAFNIDEMMLRFCNDRDVISETFSLASDDLVISGIETTDSDMHDGNLKTYILTLNDGYRLVYKPRSLSIDVAAEGILRWLEEIAPQSELRFPKSLDRGSYGWSEFIVGDDSGTLDAATYMRRCGRLLALCNVLGSNDMHYQNVIKSRNTPVPVDLETLLGAPLSEAFIHPDISFWQRELKRLSILETGLLGLWKSRGGQSPLDMSGVYGGKITTADQSDWDCLRDLENLIDGFTSLYETIHSRRTSFPTEGRLFDAIKGCNIRIIIRDTAVYEKILHKASTIDIDKDPTGKIMLLERLNLAMAISREPAKLAKIINSEITSLCCYDIPRFTAAVEGNDIYSRDGVISSAGLASSPVEDIRNRLARMSRLDLNLQIRLIRLSLLSQVINFVSDGDIYCTLNKDSSVSEDQTILLKAISDMLIQTGISHMTPSRQWIGLRFDASVSKYIPDFVNDGLVNGRFGIALVLHLIGNILNSDLYKKQADAVIQDIANSLDGERVITSERFAGFNDGIGGICYGTRILKDNGITSEALNSLDTVLQSKTTLTIERTSRKNIRRLCMKAASYLSDRYELLHDVAFEGEHKFKRPDKNQRSLPSSDSENKLFYDLRKGIDQGHREDHTIGYLYNPVAMKERASHSADKCQIERLVHYAEIPGIRYGLAGCAYSLLKLRNDKLPDLLQRV